MNSAEELWNICRDAVERLSTEQSEDAWHTLVEIGPSALPHVLEAYSAASDQEIKAQLFTVVIEYRTREALPFLAAALASMEPGEWRHALDGLVTLGGESSRRVLSEAIVTADPKKREWITEALSQIGEEGDSPSRP